MVFLCGDVPVQRLDALEHDLRVEVARQRDHGVVGGVMLLVMPVKLLARDGLQVFAETDHLVAVRVFLESQGVDRLAQAEERFVLVAFALRDDHGAFQFGLLRVEVAVDHAVGFQVERDVQLVRRQGFQVGGPVQRGQRVPKTAVARNGLVEHIDGVLGRALELHVFHPMRDAGLAGHLVARTDAVPDPVADQRNVVDFFGQDG